MTIPSFSDLDSLAANRRGELTEAQRDWLRVSNPAFNWQASGFVAAFIILISISFVPMMGSVPTEALLSVGLSMLIIGVVATIPIVRGFWQHRQLKADLAAGKVEMGEGQITWRKNSYKATTDGRPLKTQVGFTLEPGDYTVYYLPNTRWLVAAERKAMQPAEAPTLQSVLAQVHRCDGEALEANRKGDLGEGQRRYILFVCAANFFAVLVALGLIGWIVVNNGSNDVFSSGFLIVAVTLFAAGFFAVRGFKLARDLMSGAVRVAKGKGSKTASGGRSPSFYYQVGNEKFSVSANAYVAFVEGRDYKIYYLPFSKRIVNVEVGKG